MTPTQLNEERVKPADLVNTGTPAGSMRPDGEPLDDSMVPLFASNETDQFRSQWQKIQTGFVDGPQTSIHQADELVDKVIARLSDHFAETRKSLEQEWDRGENVSTEELRLALRRYRSFFDRLLSV